MIILFMVRVRSSLDCSIGFTEMYLQIAISMFFFGSTLSCIFIRGLISKYCVCIGRPQHRAMYNGVQNYILIYSASSTGLSKFSAKFLYTFERKNLETS